MMYVYIPRSRIKKRGRSKSADSRILSYFALIRGNDRRKTNQRGIIPRNFFSLLPSGRSFLLHPPGSGDEKRKTSENQAGNRIPLKTTILPIYTITFQTFASYWVIGTIPARSIFTALRAKIFLPIRHFHYRTINSIETRACAVWILEKYFITNITYI